MCLSGTRGGRVDREAYSSPISQSTSIDCHWELSFGKKERIPKLAWASSLKRSCSVSVEAPAEHT